MLGNLKNDNHHFSGIVSAKASLLEIKRYQQYKKGLSYSELNAQKTGKTLTQEEHYHAVFERDLWVGLHRLGLGFEEANTIASTYYGKKLKGRQNTFNTEHVTDLDDLTITCITKKQYQSCRSSLLKPGEDNYEKQSPGEKPPDFFKPVLLLVKKDKDCSLPTGLHAIEFVGEASHFDFFLSLICDKHWQQCFTMKLACGQHTVHFRATIKPPAENSFLNQFISDILSVILVTGRPVRNYSATFYLPLDLSNKQIKANNRLKRIKKPARHELFRALKGDSAQDNKTYRQFQIDEKTSNAQIQAYFSPLLHDQLFDTNTENTEVKPIRQYQLTAWKGREISIAEEKNPARATVSDISIYQHELGQGLLAIRLTPAVMPASTWFEKNTADTNSWWHDLLIEHEMENDVGQAVNLGIALKNNQIAEWLKLSFAFRTLYKSFISQKHENKLYTLRYEHPDKGTLTFNPSEQAFNSLVTDVLQSVEQELNIDIKQLKQQQRDDRMFVNVAYTLAGPPPGNQYAVAQNYRLFTLAFNIERPEDTGETGFSYAQNYVEHHLDPKIYKRWEQNGSYYGFSDYAHVYMGYGCYMHEEVTNLHVPHIYGQMTLLNLLYREQLRYFEHQLSSCYCAGKGAQKEAGQDSSKIRNLHKKVEIFTNQYWFRDVTEQQQGKEIFKLQSEQLQLESLYQTLDTEIKASEQTRRDRFQGLISKISVLLTFLAVLYAVLPTQDIVKESFKPVSYFFEKTSFKDCLGFNKSCLDALAPPPSKGAPEQPPNQPVKFALMQLIVLPLSLYLLLHLLRTMLASPRAATQRSIGEISCYYIFIMIVLLIVFKQWGGNWYWWLTPLATLFSAGYAYLALKKILLNDSTDRDT